jgi:hypothetical protein
VRGLLRCVSWSWCLSLKDSTVQVPQSTVLAFLVNRAEGPGLLMQLSFTNRANYRLKLEGKLPGLRDVRCEMFKCHDGKGRVVF